MKVYKYPLTTLYPPSHFEEHPQALLPSGSRILHADMQGDNIVVWAAVNPTLRTQERHTFTIVGTGQAVPPDHTHVNTFVLGEGELVLHLFKGQVVHAGLVHDA